MKSTSDLDESPLITSSISKRSKESSLDLTDAEKECKQDQNSQYSQIQNYQFVIGVIKPGQIRLGLITASLNKVTIRGKLGINKY